MYYLKSLFTTDNLPPYLLYDNMCNFLKTVQTIKAEQDGRGAEDPFITKLLGPSVIKKGA